MRSQTPDPFKPASKGRSDKSGAGHRARFNSLDAGVLFGLTTKVRLPLSSPLASRPVYPKMLIYSHLLRNLTQRLTTMTTVTKAKVASQRPVRNPPPCEKVHSRFLPYFMLKKRRTKKMLNVLSPRSTAASPRHSTNNPGPQRHSTNNPSPQRHRRWRCSHPDQWLDLRVFH